MIELVKSTLILTIWMFGMVVGDATIYNLQDSICKGQNITEYLSENFTKHSLVNLKKNFLSDPQTICLNLKGAGIKSVDVDAFDNLPMLRYLDLSDNDFDAQTVFNKTHPNLEVLVLDRTYLSDPDNFPKTEQPKLRNLFMQSLKNEDWQFIVPFNRTFPSLTEFNLFSNTGLKRFAFEWLPNSLEYLDLTWHSFDPNVTIIQNLGNLSTLLVGGPYENYKIGKNNVVKFKNLGKLESLDLTFNDIPHINFGTFEHLPMLKELDLSYNSIQSIEDCSFDSLESLRSLKLRSNNIQFLNSSIHNLSEGPRKCNSTPDAHPVKHNVIISSSSLEELDLSRNDILYIECGAFDGMKNLKTLYLTLILIQSLSNLCIKIENLTSLYLTFNMMKEINSTTFKNFSSLEKLDLSTNLIVKIEEGSFDNMKNLKELNLEDNQLRILPNYLFGKLENLEILHLTRNEIQEIKTKTFANLPSLKILYLTRNKIVKIEKGSFDSMKNLNRLYLDFNQIRVLPNYLFDKLENLNSLFLTGNKIQKINSKTFANLPSLTSLHLSNNEIVKIEEGSFDSMKNLNYLYLNGNRIKVLSNYLFDKLHSLNDLYLSYNKIQKINSTTFTNLSLLNTLDLSGNQIVKIDDGSFDSMKNLKSLNLLYNKGTFKDLRVPQGAMLESL